MLAQDTPAPVVRLTLDEARARAVEASHRLAEARARETVAQAVIEARVAAERPSVSASGGYTRTNHVVRLLRAGPHGAAARDLSRRARQLPHAARPAVADLHGRPHRRARTRRARRSRRGGGRRGHGAGGPAPRSGARLLGGGDRASGGGRAGAGARAGRRQRQRRARNASPPASCRPTRWRRPRRSRRASACCSWKRGISATSRWPNSPGSSASIPRRPSSPRRMLERPGGADLATDALAREALAQRGPNARRWNCGSRPPICSRRPPRRAASRSLRSGPAWTTRGRTRRSFRAPIDGTTRGTPA